MAHFTELIDDLPLTAALLSRALDVVCAKEGSGSEEERRAEWLPLFFRPLGDSGSLVPLFSMSSEDPATMLEQNLASWTPSRWQILAERATKVRPKLLAALYFDLLWKERRRHQLPVPNEFARSAMKRWDEAARERIGNGDLIWDALLACRSLARLARELNDKNAVLDAVKLIGRVTDALESKWRTAPGWPLRAADAVVWAVGLARPADRSPELLDEARAMISRLERFVPDGDVLLNSPIGRDVMSSREALEDLLGIDNKKLRARQRADSMAEEAKLRAAGGDSLVAGAIMFDAVKAYTALGERDLVADAKRQARQLFEGASANMQTMSFTTTTPVALVDEWLDSMLGGNGLGVTLRLAVADGALIPPWRATREAAQEGAAETPLLAMMPTMSIVDGRPVSSAPDGMDEIADRQWAFAIKFRVHMFWRRLVEKMKLEKGLTTAGLMKELEQADLLPPHNRRSLQRAVDAALAGDHFVGCHMLPPVIEAALRHVLGARGVDTSAFTTRDGGKIQERMGALFDEDRSSALVQATIGVLGEDLWAWYRTVLFDENGFNLRNRAAHGLLRDDECNVENTDTLLLALVALLRVEGTREPVVQPR